LGSERLFAPNPFYFLQIVLFFGFLRYEIIIFGHWKFIGIMGGRMRFAPTDCVVMMNEYNVYLQIVLFHIKYPRYLCNITDALRNGDRL
jgi:hypothetical protein